MNKEIITYINNQPIYRKKIAVLPKNKDLLGRSRTLRKAGVLSEVIFWLQVHKGNFYKLDFDRQRIIGNYIVDFYIKALGLIIEIDGSSHNDKEEYDEKRELFFKNLCLDVYKISDTDVKFNLEKVMLDLEQHIFRNYSNHFHSPLEGCP